MSNIREACLRKQLLTRIFFQTLTHDEGGDFYNESSAHETPSRETMQLSDLPKTTGEQLTVPGIEEQNIMEGKIQNEILQENGNKLCSELIKKKEQISLENGLLSDVKDNDNELNISSTSDIMDLQDSLNSADTSQVGTETNVKSKRTCYATLTQKTEKAKKSERRALKKYSKILNLIEELERRITEFCDKENATLMDVSESSSAYVVPRLQYIKSSYQKEIYEKYKSKTSKACKQLEAKIHLYSRYIETLETTIKSVPKDSEIFKVLQAKVKKAHKFHLENPLHKEVKELDRQCKLIGLLLKRFLKQNSAL